MSDEGGSRDPPLFFHPTGRLVMVFLRGTEISTAALGSGSFRVGLSAPIILSSFIGGVTCVRSSRSRGKYSFMAGCFVWMYGCIPAFFLGYLNAGMYSVRSIRKTKFTLVANGGLGARAPISSYMGEFSK